MLAFVEKESGGLPARYLGPLNAGVVEMQHKLD